MGKETVFCMNTVYRTKSYDLFKILEGNRTVGHAAKVENSILDNGYIFNPIIVNERYEIIDGQGRYEALKSLDLPIDFIKVKGLGIKECQVMNMAQTNWATIDYIRSYACNNHNYELFLDLVEQYGKDFGTYVIANIACRIYSSGGGTTSKIIKSGQLKFTDADYAEVVNLCEWMKPLCKVAKSITGRPGTLYQALAFAYRTKGKKVDKKRLATNFAKYADRMIDPSLLRTAFDDITKIYNIGLSGNNKIFFWEEYQREVG